MKDQKRQLEKRREILLRRLSALGPWIQGLVVVKRVCRQKGCACHCVGKKHPAMYLTGKEAGKTVSLYVPRKMEAEVKLWAGNYKKLKKLVRKVVSEIRAQILKLQEKQEEVLLT